MDISTGTPSPRLLCSWSLGTGSSPATWEAILARSPDRQSLRGQVRAPRLCVGSRSSSCLHYYSLMNNTGTVLSHTESGSSPPPAPVSKSPLRWIWDPRGDPHRRVARPRCHQLTVWPLCQDGALVWLQGQVSIASPQGAETSRGPDDPLLMRRAGGSRPSLGQQICAAQDVPGY